VFTPTFSLYPLQSEGAKPVPDIAKIKQEILNDPEMKELREGPALDAILMSLANGFSIEGSSNNQDACNSTSGAPNISAHLVMRSLMGLMAAAAQEQLPYDTLEHANPAIPTAATFRRSSNSKSCPDFPRPSIH